MRNDLTLTVFTMNKVVRFDFPIVLNLMKKERSFRKKMSSRCYDVCHNRGTRPVVIRKGSIYIDQILAAVLKDGKKTS